MSRILEIDGKQYRLEPDGELYANHGDTSRLVCVVQRSLGFPPRVFWRDPYPDERAAILAALRSGELLRRMARDGG